MNNKEKVELWLLRIKNEPERWTVRQAMDDIYPEQYTIPNTMYVGDKQFGTSGVSGNHPVGAVGTIGTGIGGAGGNGKNRGGAY